MFTPVSLKEFKAQPYAAIRKRVSIASFGGVIGSCLDETMTWLDGKSVKPAGVPLVRYHECPTVPDGDAMVDVSIGWPIQDELTSEGNITCDTLPEGRYASLVFTGVENGIAGNGALIQWALDNDVLWESRGIAGGELFTGRVEYMIDGPEDDPNPSNWRTEVAIKIAKGPSPAS